MFKLELGNSDSRFYVPLPPFNCIGPVDQPEDRLLCKQEASGSNPDGSTIISTNIFLWQTPLDIYAHDSSNYAGDYG